jgi:vacuolar-type H+-ATPase subunit E/Vma4
MYQQLAKGEMPAELSSYSEKFVDDNGKPIIDSEGGAIIQPTAGFVVKTKDKTG